MPHQGCGFIREEVPCIACDDGDRIVIATNGSRAVYKYFTFIGNEKAITFSLAAQGKGTLTLLSDDSPIGSASLSSHSEYETVVIPILPVKGTHALTLLYHGTDPVRIRDFSFETVK